MKTLMMVISAFLGEATKSSKSPNGSIQTYVGNDNVGKWYAMLFSYRSPLAIRHNGAVYVNTDLEHYSHTTQRQLNRLRVMVSQSGFKFTLNDISFKEVIDTAEHNGDRTTIQSEFSNCTFPSITQIELFQRAKNVKV